MAITMTRCPGRNVASWNGQMMVLLVARWKIHPRIQWCSGEQVILVLFVLKADDYWITRLCLDYYRSCLISLDCENGSGHFGNHAGFDHGLGSKSFRFSHNLDPRIRGLPTSTNFLGFASSSLTAWLALTCDERDGTPGQSTLVFAGPRRKGLPMWRECEPWDGDGKWWWKRWSGNAKSGSHERWQSNKSWFGSE